MNASTYTPGMGKPIPLTPFGLGGSIQREMEAKRPAVLRAKKFAQDLDALVLGDKDD